jgi:hypothetical protein
MSSFVVLIIILLAFLGGDDILNLFGYHHHDFSSSSIFRLHPLTYLSSILLIYIIVVKKIKLADVVGRMKFEFLYLAVCALVILYLQVTHKLSAISFMFDTLCLPAVISVLMKITDKNVLFKYRVVIVSCFLLNATMAIVEKVRRITLLNNDDFHFDFFRSTALYAHPLNNALIMSVLTLMLFFGTYSPTRKLLIISFGLISIVCFGARGALLGVFFGVCLNIIIGTFSGSRRSSVAKGILYLGFISTVGIAVLSFTSLGDRISAVSHVDGSAKARIEAFDVLHGFSVSDLLWGYGTAEIDYFQYTSGVEIIENFWIDWLLRFGLFGTCLLAIFLIKFLWNMMRGTPIEIKLPLLLVTFLVASTNNSLSTNTLVLSMFVLSYNAFYQTVKENKVPNYLT